MQCLKNWLRFFQNFKINFSSNLNGLLIIIILNYFSIFELEITLQIKLMMKAIIGIIILSSLSLLSLAQNSMEDVVYLKNGGIVRGKIIEYFPDQHVKIESIGGNVWVFTAAEIDRLEKEEAIGNMRNRKTVKLHEKGYFNHTSLGLNISTNSSYYYYYEPMLTASIYTINAYRFSNGMSLGLGIGPDFTGYPSFPLFIDGRYEFTKNKLTPIAIIQAGYTIVADGSSEADYDLDYVGGYLLNAKFGIKASFSDHSALIISLGYKRQEQYSKYFNPNLNTTVKRRDEFNRFLVTLGFEFH
jgi:hypothetical protein